MKDDGYLKKANKLEEMKVEYLSLSPHHRQYPFGSRLLARIEKLDLELKEADSQILRKV